MRTRCGVGSGRSLVVESMLLAGISVLGLVAVAVTALRPIRVTAGWTDQSLYHMPTVVHMARRLPGVDIADVQTATGPLYHLSLAVPGRVLGLSEAAIQVLGGWFYLTLLVAAVLSATRDLQIVVRLSLGVAVLASPYVWESTLWVATDTAALAFGLVALTLLVGLDGSPRRAALAGVTIALVIATRQSFAWLLMPALVAGLSAVGHRAGDRARLRTVVLLCAPGAVVLAVMVLSWRGLTPPRFADINGAGPNPVGPAYGFALWAFFACPLLAAVVNRHTYRRGPVLAAVAAGVVAAVPAIIWRSDYNGEGSTREGGWIWILVKTTGDVGQRSPLLIVLAFVGGAALVLLLVEVSARRGQAMAALVGTSVVGSIASAAAATHAYQKYYEVPMLICVLATLLALQSPGALELRRTPLAAPAALQVLSLAAIVGAPVAAALL